MSLPTVFATLPASPKPQLSLFDDNFNALGLGVVIPCVVSGTNTLTLPPDASMPTPSFTNLVVKGVAANTNSGAVTAAVGGLAAKNVYKDTAAGPVVLTGNEIVAGNAFLLIYDAALNAAVGGYHLQTPTIATLASVADARLLANISGGSASPSAQSFTAILDYVFSATQGAILARGASNWAANVETAWTPALTFSGASVGVTYGTQVGRYLSLGFLTIGLFNIVLTSKGSSVGAAALSLPASAGGSGRTGSLIISNYTALAAGVTGGLFGNIAASSATASLYTTGGAGTVTPLSDTSFTNTSTLSGFVLLFTG